MSEDDYPRGVEEWIENTTALDRVKGIASGRQKPISVAEVAEEAFVSKNTARSHLERLTEYNILQAETQGETTLYSANPRYTRFSAVEELLDEYDRAELMELRSKIQERIEGWREEFEVEEREELGEAARKTEFSEETKSLINPYRQWGMEEYRLSLVNEALRSYEETNPTEPASA